MIRLKERMKEPLRKGLGDSEKINSTWKNYIILDR
jgi:hypothetical protein